MDKFGIECTEKIIYLMLNNKSCINDFISYSVDLDIFPEKYKFIIDCILEQYEEFNSLLTFEVFNDKLDLYKNIDEKIPISLSYTNCISSKEEKDNFFFLLGKIIEKNSEEKLNEALSDFKKNKKNSGLNKSIKQLYLDLSDIVENTDKKIFEKSDFYDDISSLIDPFFEYVEKVKKGEIEEKERILSGINEIDYTMVTGFEQGTLTLFCADVASYKSSIMLNIGLNIWRSGHNVLHVPIEMGYDQMLRRALARECKIPFEKLTKDVGLLTDEDLEKLSQISEDFRKNDAKFYIMQLASGTSVSKIKNKIEKEIERFKPEVVIVDYIANMDSDRNRYGRNDLEVGDILKGLRDMGKFMNFATISAAQLGRDSLRRMRSNASNDKFQFNSEDIRGSHEYAADADNIYAQMVSSAQPNQMLIIYPVKIRNGKNKFEDGSNKATLEICPEYGLIKSFSALEDYNEVFEDYDNLKICDDIDMNEDINVLDEDVISKNNNVEEDDDGLFGNYEGEEKSVCKEEKSSDGLDDFDSFEDIEDSIIEDF